MKGTRRACGCVGVVCGGRECGDDCVCVWYCLLVLFDPTRLAPVENLVRIGTGIDAGDVAFSTFYGEIEMLKIEPIITDKLDD